ncbi:MAG: hypothetical protein K1X72_14805 [Pyrinomonadaceae bacterium]|nr:hypothetical protein [Pyrinomonadaceae bacterium]
MTLIKNFTVLLFIFVSVNGIFAQTKPEILNDEALKRVVPVSFYFAGQSAPTQMRNSAAVQFGKDRFVVVGMVDTSGYSTEIQGKYEGFFITDFPVKIGGKSLNTGAYGFGFSKEALNIFDLSSKQILSVKVAEDAELKRPRPLMMTADDKGVRFYKGKTFVMLSAK